jgi:hypothetical protein
MKKQEKHFRGKMERKKGKAWRGGGGGSDL